MACGMTFAALPLCVQAENSLDYSVENEAYYLSSEVSENAELAALFEGEGTKENPYILSTPQHFSLLAVMVNNGNSLFNSAYYKLGNSIDFSGVSGYIPIGKVTTELVAETDSSGNFKTDSDGNIKYKETETAKKPFMGHFDGNGYTIRNLTINSDERVVGLFGIAHNASVKNLRIENMTINAERDRSLFVGSLFGRYEGDWKAEELYITGCHVDGKITTYGKLNAEIGGMVGRLNVSMNTVLVNNCRCDVDIDATAITYQYAGGFIGNVETGADINKCVITGSVYGETTGDSSSYVGGVAARLRYNDWIGVSSLSESASLMSQKGYTSLSNTVVSSKVESVAKYSEYIGNTVAQYYSEESTISRCYTDAAFYVTPSGNAYKNDIVMERDELFDKSFLSGNVGLDYESTWTTVLGKPDLISKDSYIAYEYDDASLLYLVEPVNCGSCTVYAAAYDTYGRVAAARIEKYIEGNPVEISFGETEYASVKLFAFGNGFSPLCTVKEIK